MTEDSNSKAYARGVHDAMKKDPISDLAQGVSKGINFSKEDECYDKGYEYGIDHRDPSCCYLTTACLEAHNIIPHSSLEIKAMKTLVQEHILKSFGGKKDYIMYQRKAPSIVQKILARPEARDIWKQVYSQIRAVTEQASNGNFEQAYQSYKTMMLDLQNKYLN